MAVALGSIIYSAVKPIFKIYIITGIGFILAKRNVLTVSTCRDISDAIVTAILPCLIFTNIVKNLASSDIKSVGIIFFTATVLFGVGILFAYITYIVTRSPKRWLGGLLSVGLFPNISDLPIAYVQTLTNGGMVFSESEGDKGVAYVCIFLAAQAFYQFTLGLYALIQWDFRDEDDDEKVIGSGSDTASARHTHDTISSNASTPNADSYDDALSISSSLPSNQMVEVPLPTNLGEETYRTGSQRLSHRIGTASLLPIRSRDLRSMKSQDIGDVINEYSEYDRLNDNSNLSGVQRMITLGSDTIGPAIMVGGESLSKPLTNASKIEVVTSKVRQRLYSILKNTLAPVSISLILALAVAMAPPLKALFVSSAFSIPDAPDGLPPLSFLLDTASYMGQASVPLGLLLLGATISRLDLKGMPKGFYKTVLGIVLFRLVLLPMVGVGLVAGLNRAGWYDGNKLIRFISVLEFGLPNATALVYFTAFYTDPNSEDHIQMDCLAAALISQYAVLFITLPFLVSFTIKVTLGY
ncbi:hypothetical protein CANTEDRAFT_117682 [Yamadazyma tenuis ATCC 10573]|uniref:Auxin efflux carrier n=1 Tax=Candida tenuis (strain ATCC 10573 / BCRC 21748 / CBS 615 / JCM 9827 / NBRC 10315 / NRRL Y-1498 / VKM Y-70) TaxID=590646 RepID=G3AWS3_CANTC|nr:uncharacterized protein CANTEDRAFT_117682 [Yamadazyma tenuis ATCC 10573]EGV66601.1 hypothetical protein CANTEDRAFT_117682 [Yamadazyma tenuis ATCC 10573]